MAVQLSGGAMRDTFHAARRPSLGCSAFIDSLAVKVKWALAYIQSENSGPVRLYRQMTLKGPHENIAKQLTCLSWATV